MKISHTMINSVLDFSTDSIISVVIENPNFMYRLVSDICNQVEGNDGATVFSIDNQPISAKRYVEIITDVVAFDINTSSLITKVNARINAIANDEAHFERTNKIMADFERHIEEIILDFDANFYCSKLAFSQCIKSCGIKAEDAFESIGEKLYTYMQLVREFEGEKLFIIVNSRSFIEQEEYRFLVNNLIVHDYKVLFLDNKAYDVVDNEKRLIIDSDLCEI